MRSSPSWAQALIRFFLLVSIAFAFSFGVSGLGSHVEVPHVSQDLDLGEEDFAFLLPEPADALAANEGGVVRWTAEDVYYYQVHAFYRDLMATGRVPENRARIMARVAVDEALRLRVPPAMVFGVMYVENARFDPTARGGVGEIGLMQVRPSIWLPEYGPLLGWNLEDEVTNIRFGVNILKRYANKSQGNWEQTLLRYNGWGSLYPGRVRDRVEAHAEFLCPSGNFDQCVARPLFRWTHAMTSQ
jgi:hypothetical protein